jgi:hypothetical protein
VPGVDAAEAGGGGALDGQRVAVAGDGVVGGEQGGQEAADDQDALEVGGPVAPVAGHGGEEHPGGVLCRGPDGFAVAEGLDDDQTMKAAMARPSGALICGAKALEGRRRPGSGRPHRP